MNEPYVTIDEVGLGAVEPEPIGRGGQATVHRLLSLRLPDCGGDLVYKRYRVPTLVSDGVPDLIRCRSGMAADTRRWLDRFTLWPVRAVVDRDQVLGVVMPLIDPGFMHHIRHDMGTLAHRPREAQWLMTAPELLARSTTSGDATTEDRFGVCRDLAAALRLLHDSGITFGDISPKNALWRVDDAPTLQLIDCDGARWAGTRTTVRQLNTPDWNPPEPGPLSPATDLYKLGLFVLRVLAPGRGQTGSRDPERARPLLGDIGTGMLAAALGAPPSGRPTAAQWFHHLTTRAPVAPPSIHSVRLDDDVVVRGRPVVVEWDATGAIEVDVHLLDGPSVRVAANEPPTATVSPLRSGPIRIVARNRFGETVRDTAPVFVLDPPVIRAPAVPDPTAGTVLALPEFPAPDFVSVPGGITPIPLPVDVRTDAARLPLPALDLPVPATAPGPAVLPGLPTLIGTGGDR